MAKFNKAGTGTKTINLAGGEAFSENPKLEIISILLTSFVNDQYYRSASDTLKRLRTLITLCPDKKWVAKASLYARHEFGMRSITHFVGAEIGKLVHGETWKKNYFERLVKRPDDITETISAYLTEYGFPLPHGMIKGFKKKLSKMSEYVLAKYRGESKSLKMIDVVNLLHPKGTEALKKLMKGELKNTETWEAKLTESGKRGESEEEVSELKAAAWGELLRDNKLGYLALLRNFKNIMEQAPDVLDLALAKLINKDEILRSLTFPHQYLIAMKRISGIDGANSRKVLAALSEAMNLSVSNIPAFDGKSLVVIDESGSMTTTTVSSMKNDGLMVAELAALLGFSLAFRNNSDVLLFANEARFCQWIPGTPLGAVLKGIKFNGGGTDFRCIFTGLKEKYDRIFIFSDMQGWVGYQAPTSELNNYKNRTGANPRIYSFDLAGYGSLQFPENNIFCLAGFSAKIFDMMKLLEQDRNELIKKIDKVEL